MTRVQRLGRGGLVRSQPENAHDLTQLPRGDLDDEYVARVGDVVDDAALPKGGWRPQEQDHEGREQRRPSGLGCRAARTCLGRACMAIHFT